MFFLPASSWITPNDFPCQTGMTTRQQNDVQHTLYDQTSPFDHFNLALHVGDNPEKVQQNRQALYQQLPSPAVFVRQVHGVEIHNASPKDRVLIGSTEVITADALFTSHQNLPLAILTADCLPLVIANESATHLAVLHCGWRGLALGLIEKTINLFQQEGVYPSSLHVWMGAAIGPNHFEVGQDVLSTFSQSHGQTVEMFFSPTTTPHKYMTDLYQIAHHILSVQGVYSDNILTNQHCTFSEPANFFSFRRDRTCGRMATIAWL
jgi:YfiH family protein